jgi:hypothetical protein
VKRCDFDGVLGGYFYSPEKGGAGWPAWARVRVSASVPVATLFLEEHGHVWRSCGDVGSLVAQQGDEGSSGTAGAHEVTGGDFLRLHSVGTRRGKARAWAEDVEATHGTDSASVGMQERPCLHCLQ